MPDGCTLLISTCISQSHWLFHCERKIQRYENWLSNSAVSADMQTELHTRRLAAERYCGSTWDKWCFSPSCKSETRKWSFFYSTSHDVAKWGIYCKLEWEQRCVWIVPPPSCAVSVPLSPSLSAERGGYGASEHPCGVGYSLQFPHLSVDLSRRMPMAVRAPRSIFPHTHTHAEDRVEL